MDSITCIDFLEKDERILVLTASSDCSVVLSDIKGNAYGTFGQPNQWRLDVDLEKLHEMQEIQRQNEERARKEKEEKEEEEGVRVYIEEPQMISSQDFDDLSTTSDEEMLTRRSNVWKSTSIGNLIDKYYKQKNLL